MLLGNGGNVTNGAPNVTTALIKDDTFATDIGIEVNNAAGTVANYGIVSGGYGIFLRAGGAVTNANGASVTGQYEGIIVSTTSTASVTNLGMVLGIGTARNTGAGSVGVRLAGNGTVINGSTAVTTATIQADERGSGGTLARGLGIDIDSFGTLVNYGTARGTRVGAELFAGGNATNGPGGARSALLAGSYFGVYIGASATIASAITNFGAITRSALAGSASASRIRQTTQ